MMNRMLSKLNINPRPLLWMGLTGGLLLVAACQPVRAPEIVAAERTAMASGAMAAAPTEVATPLPASEVPSIGPAQVTVSTDRLRVRALPVEDAEIVARVTEGNTYPVIGISSDGEWLQIEVDEAPEGSGWVSAEFVTLAGDITNIPIVDVPMPVATATAEPTEEATPEATPEATVEPTEEATPEATPEATAEPTEEATPEATPEATAEPTEEATPEATPEATAEPTEEATPEATPEATEEPTEEATPEATAMPDEEATDLGTVTVAEDLDLPLRVRSAPTSEVENKIGNVFPGETYPVLEISADGLWVRIAVPEIGDGSGWITAEFVVFNEAP
jgi:hypothetical protein